MTTYTAIEIIEMTPEATDEEKIEAFQSLIDSGMVWQLQGWYGRTAMDLINAGLCTATLDRASSQDERTAYLNRIEAR